MSPVNSVLPSQVEGRTFARRRIDGLAYADLAPDKHLIVIDAGEGGLGFQSVAPISFGPAVFLSFKLPGEGIHIQSNAEVAWLNESGERGGLQFIGLPEEVRLQIRAWIAGSSPRVKPTHLSAADTDQRTKPRVEGLPAAVRQATAETPLQVSSQISAVPAPSDLHNTGRLKSMIPDIHTIQEFVAYLSADAAEPKTDDSAKEILSRTVQGAIETKPIVQPAPSESTERQSFTGPSGRAEFALPMAPVRETPRFAFPIRIRLTRKLVFPREREPSPFSPEHDLNAKETPAARSFGVGIAVGVCVALTVTAGTVAVRTWLGAAPGLATSTPKPNAGSLSAFQVDVVDLNNRHWTLKNDVGPAPAKYVPASRRDKSDTTASIRKESGEPTPGFTPDSTKSTASAPPQMSLPRPLPAQLADAPAEAVTPSIFDGITPPLGSVIEDLAPSGQGLLRPAQTQIQPETQQPRRRAATLQDAVLLQRVNPVYPPFAAQARVQGEVLISATIGKDGIPKNLRVISGNQFLVAAALAAVRQWRYSPATLGGQPIDSQAVITVAFELK